MFGAHCGMKRQALTSLWRRSGFFVSQTRTLEARVVVLMVLF